MPLIPDSIKNIGTGVALISGISTAAVYLTSFAKTSDVQKTFDSMNEKVEKQRERIEEVHTKLDVHEALLRQIDQEINVLLRRKK